MSCVTCEQLLLRCLSVPATGAPLLLQRSLPSAFISADWPPPQHTRIAGPSSRCERLSHVQVAAKPDEVARSLQICRPAPEPRVIAQVVVGGQSLGKLYVLAVINPRVR